MGEIESVNIQIGGKTEYGTQRGSRHRLNSPPRPPGVAADAIYVDGPDGFDASTPPSLVETVRAMGCGGWFRFVGGKWARYGIGDGEMNLRT